MAVLVTKLTCRSCDMIVNDTNIDTFLNANKSEMNKRHIAAQLNDTQKNPTSTAKKNKTKQKGYNNRLGLK